jgi:adenosylcobinamide-phosphate synthase
MNDPAYLDFIQIFIASVLDIAIGDPQWNYHPVRLMGRSIEITESILRKFPIPERMAGILLTIIIVFGIYSATYAIMFVSRQWCFFCEGVIGAIIIYFAVSIKSLADEAKKVMRFLRGNDLIRARKVLSQIVGRDTEQLNEEQVIRACVETVAEGSLDGVLSPLFYSFLGGPGAAMAYRAVNTLDSMVGHKDEKHIRFGWASARLDDAANYIPARISAILIPVASFLCGYGFKRSLKIAFRDGRKHESPNSGIPEAAMAGALGIRLGGSCTYQGEIIERSFIGDAQNHLTLESIAVSIKILYVTSLLFIICGIGVVGCIKYVISPMFLLIRYYGS